MRLESFVAVNAIVVQAERVLLTRRSASVREPFKWCLPGGHVEIGEGWVCAMKRELNEEMGILAKESFLLGVYSDPALTLTQDPIDALSGQFHAHFVVAAFIVSRFEGNPKPNHEVSQWGWFGKDTLPGPMIRSHPIRLLDFWAGRVGVVR